MAKVADFHKDLFHFESRLSTLGGMDVFTCVLTYNSFLSVCSWCEGSRSGMCWVCCLFSSHRLFPETLNTTHLVLFCVSVDITICSSPLILLVISFTGTLYIDHDISLILLVKRCTHQ